MNFIFTSLRKYYYYGRPIGDISETHRKPTSLIRDASETDIPDRRPKCMIGDPSETNIPHWRPTCLIGDPSETNMPIERPTCLSGDPSEIDMPHWRPTCLRGDPLDTHMSHRKSIRNTCLDQGRSSIRHVCNPWVSDQACPSPMGL